MQLIKLVYIAHGWTLGLYNQPLIGKQVEAWTYGPVIPSVYHDFKHYGRDPITQQKAKKNNKYRQINKNEETEGVYWYIYFP